MPAYDRQSALIVVDVQNDFADPGGSLYVAGGGDVVPLINEEIRDARSAGAFVVYTQDWHPASTPHFEKDGGIWPVHCVADAWGAEFHPGLEVDGPVVPKGTRGEDGYSGFTVRDPQSGDEHATELGSLLRERGIQRVIIAGLATDYCVKDTAIDAVNAGFETTVLAKAIRAVNLQPGDGNLALEAMRAAGATIE
jgi:nicotinamidase/pyrazinamidase